MRTQPKTAYLALFLALSFAALSIPQLLFGEISESDVTSPLLSRLAERDSRIEGQYIVVFEDSVTNPDVAEEEILTRVSGERLDSYRSVMRGFAARFSESAALSIAEDPRVAFVSEDREISIALSRETERGGIRQFAEVQSPRTLPDRGRSNPPADQTPAPNPEPKPNPNPAPTPPPEEEKHSTSNAAAVSTQTLPTGIDRINAEGLANTGNGVHVAVIDTGILATHPDLAGKVVGGKNCTKASNGSTDQNGHGTHVAGTIAAANDMKGVVGVAPDVKLWAVRVLDKNGGGSWSNVICGLDFVVSNAPKNGGPIKVANLSLGGGGSSDGNCGNSNGDALHKAICRARDAGVTIIVAAGNSGTNAANFVPAAYSDAVITVSALADTDGKRGGTGSYSSFGADDTFASFSNWGTPIDIGAPGVAIYSTWIGNGYKSASGTSMASPHVAGAAALYIATHPNALWIEVRDALISLAEVIGSGHTDPSGKHPERVLQVGAL